MNNERMTINRLASKEPSVTIGATIKFSPVRHKGSVVRSEHMLQRRTIRESEPHRGANSKAP